MPALPTHTITLLTLIAGLHAGDEGIALVAAVILIRVIQGHAHALVLVPLIPDIAALNGVLDALLLCTKATRSAPTLREQRRCTWQGYV